MKTSLFRQNGIKLSFIISAVVLLAVFVTFAVNTLVSYTTHKDALSNTMLELNQITANELSHTAHTLIVSMQESMKAESVHLAEYENSKTRLQSELDSYRSTVPYFNSVFIADRDGVVQTVSPQNPKLTGHKLKSEAANLALSSRKPQISLPYTANTGRFIVLVSQPIFDSDGQFAGYIAGTIYLQENNVFRTLLGSQSINENGTYFYVVSSTGMLIYHPIVERIGEDARKNPVVAKLMAGDSGTMALTNLSGEHFLAGYAIVPTVGWGIVSQTPSSNIEAVELGIFWRMVLISVPIVLFLLLFVMWVSKQITLPLNRLAIWAARFNRGEVAATDIPKIKTWNYESKELYKAVSEAFHVMDDRTEEMSHQVYTDTLTGLANRRFIDEVTGEWMEQGRPFAIIMLDLDRFKQVNDTYGHPMGDEVLRFLADRVRSEIRDSDYGCRYGGEEFTILLPYGDIETAFLIAERIRLRMKDEITPIGRPVTLSLGISAFPGLAYDLESLFAQADKALYEAKQGGRNRTVIYQPEALRV